ncbi:MAG: Gldg family protein [Thermodesulfobacteriota bacterium]
MMHQSLAVAKKELKAYFGSPMAPIFIGAFLLAALYSFFWLETFFARNLADIRPLFRWMPLLMIFLSAALTMRQWSEEQRMGTLEVLLTLPVRLGHLVAGKFLAVLALIGLALAFTLGLPLTVSFLGNLDWGPVIGGYLGVLFMAAAYIAIGLFVSSRTDNQIVALLVTVLACGLCYLLGSAGLTTFFGNQAGEVLRALGTGSRFANIERGVIDLRDLVYYGSLTFFFLWCNTVSLESQRWSKGTATAGHRRQVKIALLLVGANLLAANLWLNTVHTLRLDLTADRRFSISQVTRQQLGQLQEPLVIRGYFSEKTHPLLAPLVPQIRDVLQEYGVAGKGKVRVSFIDPRNDEGAESEANQLYNIKPVPFQVAGRYEAAVVNSYFNILIKYGDQFVTLGFDDLIEVRPRPDGQMEVGLRNLEYDLTRTVKKVVHGFQGIDTVFARAEKPLTLTAIITPNSLPKAVAGLPGQIREAAEGLAKEAGGKLNLVWIDPDDPAAGISREGVGQQFGVKPLRASLLSEQSFYLALLLKVGDTTEAIPLAADMNAVAIRQEIEAAIKRTASGFLKTVGVWTPRPDFGGFGQPRQQHQMFQQVLRENYNIEPVNLMGGTVGGDIDVLLLIAPQQMSELERFAVDQYLMRGGSVVVLGGSYQLDLPPGAQNLALKPVQGGLHEMLAHYGVAIDQTLVMDRQNEPFPVPVNRDIGGVTVQEIKHIAYPFFVDVRASGMNRQSPIVANLPAVTLNWPSPLSLNQEKLAGRKALVVLESSPSAWLYRDASIQPDFRRYPQYGFPVGQDVQKRTLAVAITGTFPSYFADRPDPRHGQPPKAEPGKAGASEPVALSPLAASSADGARLVVVGSSEFVSDAVISMAQATGQERFMNSLALVQNIVDWSVEDEALLAIRSRGSHTRLLSPMPRREQAFWEWFNYGLALAALIGVSWYGHRRRQREQPLQLDDVVS